MRKRLLAGLLAGLLGALVVTRADDRAPSPPPTQQQQQPDAAFVRAARQDFTPEQLRQAVRAGDLRDLWPKRELIRNLDDGVAVGFVTERGRALAVRCFDRPGRCDARALRWEIGLGAFQHLRR